MWDILVTVIWRLGWVGWLSLSMHPNGCLTLSPQCAVFVVLHGSLDFKSECSMKREVEASKLLKILRLMQHPCKRGNVGPRCHLMMEAMSKNEWLLKPATLDNKLFRVFYLLLSNLNTFLQLLKTSGRKIFLRYRLLIKN